MTSIDRRTFLRGTAAAGGMALASGPLNLLLARTAAAAPGGRALRSSSPSKPAGYGPLVAAGPELMLPEGFRYVAFGREGESLADGSMTPRGHDGMAAFAVAGMPGVTRLVRNHEISSGAPLGNTGPMYDATRGGGTVTLDFDVTDPSDASKDAARAKAQWVSIRGTSTNCAGGPTPWGSWLTCEETASTNAMPHGYVFDVPSSATSAVEPVPLPALGRFVHEAVAIDPATGIVYETEDKRYTPGVASEPGSGFYRFVPTTPGDLTDGSLQVLAVKGRPNYDTTAGQRIGQVLPVEWVTIDDPDPVSVAADASAVFRQGLTKGAAFFNRLEGAWWGGGSASVFFVSTNGGDLGAGQVWEYLPAPSGGKLVLLYESVDEAQLDAPDNVTVTPAGGLLLCEDGDGENYLRGLSPDGRIFDFALNTLSENEFAGATFSADGRWLFVNVQDPGTTFAITGPWAAGSL